MDSGEMATVATTHLMTSDPVLSRFRSALDGIYGERRRGTEHTMSINLTAEQLDVVRAYAAGRLGTREAIKAAADLHDYADP